jgi:hypothetical protein
MMNIGLAEAGHAIGYPQDPSGNQTCFEWLENRLNINGLLENPPFQSVPFDDFPRNH